MTEEEIRQMMSGTFESVKPCVEAMSNILMNVYQLGWETGFNIGLKVGQQ